MLEFAKKYGDTIRLLMVLICFSILLVELTILWAPVRESDDESTSSKYETTAGNVKLVIKTVDNKKVKNEDKVILNPISKPKHDTEREKKDEFKKEQVDLQIQKLLAPFVNDSLGRVLNVEFKSVKSAKSKSRDVLDIVFRKAKFWVKTLGLNRKESLQPALKRRYVYVYERYWEQLTMNTRVFMALASQAKIGGRFLVEPKVKDSVFGDTGYPFSTYYNVTQVNAVLKSNGYSTLVTREEYENECSISDNSHAIVHFLYKDNKAVSFLKNKFAITNFQYDEIGKEAKKNGWTTCEILKPYSVWQRLKTFCVDPTVITEWSVLEQGILRDVKCLGIFVWRGIGVTRTSFSEEHIKVSSNDIHFLLKPSLPIVNEAEIFRKRHLSEGYIAVQIRGEKVTLQHSLTRLKKCLRLLVNIVRNTKTFFGIGKVFVASDMSNFGSGSWGGSLKHKMLDYYSLKTIQSTLLTKIGAVVFEPSVDWQTPDRGAVSLVELSIIAHAQHLLTIGTGSFQEWAVTKFLDFHRDDDLKQWSLTRICSLP